MANSTVTDALAKLFLALGGDPAKLSDDHNLTDYLDDVADALVDAVKAELPTVSSTDNGKALVVSSGKWQKGTILPSVSTSNAGKVLAVDNQGKWAASSNLKLVEATFNKTDNVFSVTSIGKTYSDIRKMVSNGQQVALSSSMDSDHTHFPNQCFQFASGISFINMMPNSPIHFCGIGVDDGDVYAIVVSIANNDTATMTAVKLST